MKFAIVKAVALCALALSLVFVGVSVSVSNTVDTGAVARHDGPHNEGYVF